MQLEGKHAVLEALRAAMPLESILLQEGAAPDKAIDELRRLAQAAGVAVSTAPKRELDKRSERGAHQGVVAQAKAFGFAPIEKIVRATEGMSNALVIALDHVTDPGNLGAIARTAEVVGASALLVPARRSAALTPAAWKSAAGAFAHVPVVREANLVRSLEIFKDAGFWVAGASERASQSVWEAPLEGRIVLVMGSEGEGLARLTREKCDFLVSLPQAGRVGSLNVAQATTAIAYEWLRRVKAGASE